MEEDLIEAYDNFVIGNYQQCLEMAASARPASDFSKFMWDSLQARCHLGLGHMDRIRELSKGASNPAVSATAYFAVFDKSKVDSQRKSAFEKIVDNANQSGGEPGSCYFSCVARAAAGDLLDAVKYAKAVAASSPSEFNALRVQFSLALNRSDLAEAVLGESAASRDDSAAGKLAAAMYALVSGKPGEACMCYSDLIAQFDAESSLILANGRAVGNIQRGQTGEAMEDLETALGVGPQDQDAIRNMACCLAWQGKSVEARDWVGKLASPLEESGRLRGAFAAFASATTTTSQ